MPTKKALQSSVLSLQNDMPYLLGRKAVSTAAVPTTRPVAATASTVHHLDKIATTALKARAKAAASTSSTPFSTSATTLAKQQQKQQQQQQQQQASTPETFSTWRVTQPQHWSDGLIRPPTQEAPRAAPSPHWMRGPGPNRGVVVGAGVSQQQQQVLGK